MGRHDASDASKKSTAYRAPEAREVMFRHAPPRREKRKAPLWARASVILGSTLLFLAAAATGVEAFLTYRYENAINRADLLGENRGDARVDGPLNFLLLGVDKRSKDDYDPSDPSSRTWTTPGRGRTDTIMVVHVDESMENASVISIPRDTRVYIPQHDNWEGGKQKLNAAYFFGGAPLIVKTLQKLLGITIHYPVLVNFAAIREITDAVGGVDVVVDSESYDKRTQRRWKAGKHHLDGEAAEAYVRQRYGLEEGDYARQARQQQYIRALAQRLDDQKVARDPRKIDSLLRVAMKHLTVDRSMPVKELAFALTSLNPKTAQYLRFPIESSQMINSSWYELPDKKQVGALGRAIQQDAVDRFLQKNPDLRNDVSHGE